MTENGTVVVTGFGPFRQLLVNPSWEAARRLKAVGLGKKTDVYIKEVPVSYVKAQKIIAELWQTMAPKIAQYSMGECCGLWFGQLQHDGGSRQFCRFQTEGELSKCFQFAVHLGIARGSSVVILEQTGANSGYRDGDVCGFCPETHCCIEGGPDKLDSVIDMKVVSKLFKQEDVGVIYSRDAGRYLCDFTYYCSLYHGQRRAALIHIPLSGSLASTDRLVPLLQTLIMDMLKQLEDPTETALQSVTVT
ncbi:pyroglutamyl-peptidase 1 isoform 1-T1 [Pholidichthys leucotaenia]